MEECKYTHVGDRINLRIKELGLKQADLCRETGLSTTAMSQYCTGKRIPDTASLHKIAIVLDTSMEWLLEGDLLTDVNLTNENSSAELVHRLAIAIQKKGITFSRVERDCGLGNSTIKRWNTQSPRLDKLVLVAQYLDVSLDYLVYGTIRSDSSSDSESLDLDGYKAEQGLTCDGSPLSEAETDLVAMFRLLSPSHQEELFDLTYFKYRRHVEEKRESIYSTYIDTGADKKSGHTPDNHRAATA